MPYLELGTFKIADIANEGWRYEVLGWYLDFGFMNSRNMARKAGDMDIMSIIWSCRWWGSIRTISGRSEPSIDAKAISGLATMYVASKIPWIDFYKNDLFFWVSWNN